MRRRPARTTLRVKPGVRHACAAATLLLSISCGFVQAATEPFIFIHAGDPQIGVTPVYQQGIDDFITLGQRADQWGADFGLIAGDVTEAYNIPQWTNDFMAARATWNAPTYLVPGNHDVVNASSRNIWINNYGLDYYYFSHNNVLFVQVNSDMFRNPIGYQGQDTVQLQWLADTLANSAGYDQIFVTQHHPLWWNDSNEPFLEQNLPEPIRSTLFNMYDNAGISALLTGHLHFEYVVIPSSSFTTYSVGGTSNIRANGEQGYAVVDVGSSGFTHEFWQIDTVIVPAPGFSAVSIILLLCMIATRYTSATRNRCSGDRLPF